MKGTRHNGRAGKDGVYNPKHNDRRFDAEHSEHIDPDRVRQNIYWDCYQGYTTMEDREKEVNFSFTEIERIYYSEHYGDYVENQNERHRQSRHPDRCKDVDAILQNKKTCPEETVFQLGTIDAHASEEMLLTVFEEFKTEFEERFGSNVHIIDWALHMDESTPHIHERHVFDAVNRYGEIEPKQEAALEALGFELPDPSKPRSKSNNRKVVFDAACRTMFLNICKRHGLELDEEPSYGGRAYLEKQDYIRMKQKQEIAEQEERLDQLVLEISDVEQLIDEVSDEAYDKAVEQVTNAVAVEVRQDDIRLIEGTKEWIRQPERKASAKEKSYALDRLDGVIRKIENAMQKTISQIKKRLLKPEKKREVVSEIKEQVRPSIMKRLNAKREEINRKEAERRKQVKKDPHLTAEDR